MKPVIYRSILIFSTSDYQFLLAELRLPDIDLEDLKRIVEPSEEDPELYFCYTLNEDALKSILKLLPDFHANAIVIDFDRYEYSLEATSVGKTN